MAERTRLSAWLDAYGAPVKEALQRAARDGYALAHANTTRPDLDPHALGATGRRHLARFLEGLGLQLGAVAAVFPGAGLADAAHADQRLEQLRATLELARGMNVRTAVANLAGFSDAARADLAAGVLANVADLADRVGVVVAVEAPGDRFEDLTAALDRLRCPALRAAADSGTVGPEALTAAATSAAALGAVFLRDARRSGGAVEEVPMGTGAVDLAAWLAAAEAAGRDGPVTVRLDPRSAGVDGMARAREHVEFLLRGAHRPR